MLIDEILAVGDESFQRKCLRADRRADGRGRDAGARLARPERDRARLPPGRGARRRPGRLRRRRRPRACSSTTACSAPRGPASRSLRPGERGDARGASSSSCATPTARRPPPLPPGEALRVALTVECRRARRRARVAALEVRDERGEAVLPHRRHARAAHRARSRWRSRSRGWRCSAATTTSPSASTTRTRPASGLLDRVARFAVAQTAGGRGRRRPARRVDRRRRA